MLTLPASLHQRRTLMALQQAKKNVDLWIEESEGDRRHELRDLARELADWTRRLEEVL